MDGPGNKFFPSAGFPQDKNGRARPRHCLHLVQDSFQAGALSDDLQARGVPVFDMNLRAVRYSTHFQWSSIIKRFSGCFHSVLPIEETATSRIRLNTFRLLNWPPTRHTPQFHTPSDSGKYET